MLARRALPDPLFRENRTPLNFQTGSSGFGRHELMPIRTQANAVARYLGGYIRKQIENRNEVDKGSRLVRYIGFGPAERTHYPTFAWVVQGRPWRLALGEFAPSQRCYEFEDLAHPARTVGWTTEFGAGFFADGEAQPRNDTLAVSDQGRNNASGKKNR